MKFAIIETGGKQYKVSAGQKIKIEKIEAEKDGSFIFDKILLTADDGQIKIGTPYLKGAKAEAEILKQERDDKKIIFRYHSKTRYRKKKTHRQPFTELIINKIEY